MARSYDEVKAMWMGHVRLCMYDNGVKKENEGG